MPCVNQFNDTFRYHKLISKTIFADNQSDLREREKKLSAWFAKKINPSLKICLAGKTEYMMKNGNEARDVLGDPRKRDYRALEQR